MRWIIFFAVLTASASIVYYYAYLPSQLSVISDAEKDCSKLAREEHELEKKKNDERKMSVTTEYFNHYNQRLKACYMLTTTTLPYDAAGKIKGTYIEKEVIDVISHKTLAEYMWKTPKSLENEIANQLLENTLADISLFIHSPDKVKHYSIVAPIICHVEIPKGNVVLCETTDGFNELIKQYMEN